MKKLISILVLAMFAFTEYAQIGYQVSLLNRATGEPRANETVVVSVDITNSKGDVIISQTQNATTNDFGVISVTIGNSATFDNVDWSKLPFYISATVEDVLIGRSQLLSVPVAEYAKHTGSLNRKILCQKIWNCRDNDEYVFNMDGTGVYIHDTTDWINGQAVSIRKSDPFSYAIFGDIISLTFGDDRGMLGLYDPQKGKIQLGYNGGHPLY